MSPVRAPPEVRVTRRSPSPRGCPPPADDGAFGPGWCGEDAGAPYDDSMAGAFAFRMRAYAAAHFEWGDVLAVTWPDAEAKLQSEYTGGEDGRAYPVTIHGEIRGPGESLADVETRFGPMIGNTLPLIALAANAAVADPLAVATHGLDLTEPQPIVAYRTPSASEWFPLESVESMLTRRMP